jgi:hypothetical protein
VSKIYSYKQRRNLFVPQKIINYELQCISKRKQDSGIKLTEKHKKLAVSKMKQFTISLLARIDSFFERLAIRIIMSKIVSIALYVNIAFLLFIFSLIILISTSEKVKTPKGIKFELINNEKIIRIIIDVNDNIQFSGDQD